jgi:hypothetical protein
MNEDYSDAQVIELELHNHLVAEYGELELSDYSDAEVKNELTMGPK